MQLHNIDNLRALRAMISNPYETPEIRAASCMTYIDYLQIKDRPRAEQGHFAYEYACDIPEFADVLTYNDTPAVLKQQICTSLFAKAMARILVCVDKEHVDHYMGRASLSKLFGFHIYGGPMDCIANTLMRMIVNPDELSAVRCSAVLSLTDIFQQVHAFTGRTHHLPIHERVMRDTAISTRHQSLRTHLLVSSATLRNLEA